MDRVEIAIARATLASELGIRPLSYLYIREMFLERYLMLLQFGESESATQLYRDNIDLFTRYLNNTFQLALNEPTL